MTVTRRIIMQKARRHTVQRHGAPTACRHMVSGSFPPLKGVLFIFRSRYFSLSVVGEYLALRDGPRRFRPGSTCPALLGCQLATSCFRVRDYHPLWSQFPLQFL